MAGGEAGPTGAAVLGESDYCSEPCHCRDQALLQSGATTLFDGQCYQIPACLRHRYSLGDAR